MRFAAGMWLGVLHIPAADRKDGGEGDLVLLQTWERSRPRPFTNACPPSMVPTIARLLRQATSESGAQLDPPRCDACGEALDVPPLDAGAELAA